MSVSEDMYRLIPCLNGVCASPSSEVTRSIRDAKSTKGVEGVVLLPGGIAHDLLMTDETLAYPKFKDDALAYPSSVSLSEEDILNLDCSNANNFSFTVYGPGSQDKNNNQDFALSGHFSDNNGHVSRFVILADGISNGFAFPQRGAQLSCLAVYQCLKELHNEFEGSNRRLNEEDVATFREHLAQKINDLLEEDHQHLLTYFDNHHQEPPHIASKVWHKSFKENPEKWYGNTLLVSFLSPFGAFIVYAGDGGIVLLKGSSDPKDVIRSDASSAISRFVTLDVTRATFLGALITYGENDDFIEVIMATDGVDRTYQLNGMDLTAAFSEEASLDDLVDQIANLKERVSGEVDVDNYSIGRVFLPLSDKKHSRLVGEAASPTAFAPTPKSAIGMEGENEKSAAPTTHITTKNADVELQQKKRAAA